MEAQMEIQTYLEQGRAALAQGQAREAAIAYAHGALLEPDNPIVQLGLAEANLALGNNAAVQVASRKVLDLQLAANSVEAKIAQALLDLLDHCYERALQHVDAAVLQDPSIAYLHALRSHLLRAIGQDYDATLARNTAMRRGGRFENCFPLLESELAVLRVQHTEVRPLSPVQLDQSLNGNQKRSEHYVVPNWSRSSPMRRRSLRARFFLNQNPGFMTNVLLVVMVICFLLGANIASWMSVTDMVYPWEIWRYVTAVFISPQSQSNLLGLLISLFSLYFVGRAVENFYGPIRFLVIFLVSGIFCNIVYVILVLSNLGPLAVAFGLALGPVSAIMGIFGAIGIFYFVNRHALGGSGNGALVNWGFWLLLNLIMVGSIGLIAVLAELSCVIVGMVLAYLLIPRASTGRGQL